MKESFVFGVNNVRIKDGIIVLDLGGLPDSEGTDSENADTDCRLMMAPQALLQLHGAINQVVDHLMEKGLVSERSAEETGTVASTASGSPNFDTPTTH